MNEDMNKLKTIIADVLNVDPNEITADTTFTDDLGADSLDVVELTMALEEEFSLPDTPEEELANIVTVGDLANYVAKTIG